MGGDDRSGFMHGTGQKLWSRARVIRAAINFYLREPKCTSQISGLLTTLRLRGVLLGPRRPRIQGLCDDGDRSLCSWICRP